MRTYAYAIQSRHLGHLDRDGNPSACWVWQGNVHPVSGYGQAHHRDVANIIPAHRLIYQLLSEPVPVELDLDHLCRVRSCVNPGHLEPVTRAENIHRSDVVCKLNWDTVREIRASSHLSQPELARLFGVHQSTVSRILRHETWQEA